MPNFFFGSNLKMYQTPDETRCFVDELREMLPASGETQIFLIPPFTSLMVASERLHDSAVWLGAQNMHWADVGAYTGEISPIMLRASGVDLIMLGHAERRTHFGETDEALHKKVQAAVRHDLRILLCVGENAAQRESGLTRAIIESQLTIALTGLARAYLSKLMIAYEPVWSIGAGGKAADPEIVSDMHTFVRETLIELFGEAATTVPILYGGSVNPTNCVPYATLPQVDGLFVGRAAWNPSGFVELLKMVLAARV